MKTTMLSVAAVMLMSLPAQADIDGHTRSEIIACAGYPTHVSRQDTIEYLHYRHAVDTHVLPYGSAHLAESEVCETVVVLRDGLSAAAEFRTSADTLRAQLCSPPINQCLN